MAKLNDTTLCAIVRDEIINPAGGIVSFVESTVPFVDEAVTVDTGSKDGTREKLESLAGQHRNLRVYDELFRGYAAARNASLACAKTKYALVLDADELITRANFEILERAIRNHPHAHGYNLDFTCVSPPGELDSADGKRKSYGHNPRLFPLDRGYAYNSTLGPYGPEFLGRAGQSHDLLGISDFSMNTRAEILHFLQSSKAMARKKAEWYEASLGVVGVFSRTVAANQASSPSDLPSFKRWKELNPRRLQYA